MPKSEKETLTVPQAQAELIKALGKRKLLRGAESGIQDDIRTATGKLLPGRVWREAVANEVKAGRVRQSEGQVVLTLA